MDDRHQHRLCLSLAVGMIVSELYLKVVVFEFLKVFVFSKVKLVYHPQAWWWSENKDWIAVLLP